MTRPMIRIHDITTDEVIDREMDDAEYRKHLENIEAYRVEQEAETKTQKDKAALLTRLGLTEDELKTILG